MLWVTMCTPECGVSCMSQAFAASVLADGLTQLPNLPRVCRGWAEGKPTLGNGHAQNACVCWQARAEPQLVKWWHVGCLWVPLVCLCLWVFTGSTLLPRRVGSLWPLVLRMRTADCLLHPQPLPCRVAWGCADALQAAEKIMLAFLPFQLQFFLFFQTDLF